MATKSEHIWPSMSGRHEWGEVGIRLSQPRCSLSVAYSPLASLIDNILKVLNEKGKWKLSPRSSIFRGFVDAILMSERKKDLGKEPQDSPLQSQG